jgi:hypothetical protein
MVCDFFGVSTSVFPVNSKSLNSGTGTSSVSSSLVSISSNGCSAISAANA